MRTLRLIAIGAILIGVAAVLGPCFTRTKQPPHTAAVTVPTVAPTAQSAVPPAPDPARPMTPEERAKLELNQLKARLDALRGQDQAARMKTWTDGSWLRLDDVRDDEVGLKTVWTLFIPDGAEDLFYVYPAGSFMLAGNANLPLKKSEFPDLRKEKNVSQWGTVRLNLLRKRARERIPRGQEVQFRAFFPKPESGRRLEFKLRVIRPQEDSDDEMQALGGPKLPHNLDAAGSIVTLTWDAQRRAEIDEIKGEVERKEATK